MNAVYDNQQAPVGAMISGRFLKEMIERKFFPVTSALINGEIIEADELDFSLIDDKETFVVIFNSNCGDVEFLQVFTEEKVSISTGLKASSWNR